MQYTIIGSKMRSTSLLPWQPKANNPEAKHMAIKKCNTNFRTEHIARDYSTRGIIQQNVTSQKFVHAWL